jgi:predicted nucleic acid-binding protein
MGEIAERVTLLEVLMQPLAQQRHDLVQTYTESLPTLLHLSLCQIDEEIAVKAAEIRAIHKLKTADAIQVAAAFEQI